MTTRRTPRERASVKDVAALAGVSLGTVSNVLNRPDRVSARTRDRVESAIAELSFVRNDAARQLRDGQSLTLAYVMLDASNPFFTDVSTGIEAAADVAGLSLFLCNSANSAEREQRYLDHLQAQRVLGVLITPVDPDAPALDEVIAHGTPVVVVDRTRTASGVCSVSVDDVLGGRLAIEHLLDRGHRRVAVVGGPTSLGQVRDRWSGARAAWGEAGLPAEDLVRLDTAAMTVEDGRGAGERLSGLPHRRQPTAAFCVNDLLALGLLQQSVATGRSVPGELAIVGYDDIDFAAAAAVPLSSVRQPRHALGRTAAGLLLDEADHPATHEHQTVVFTPELVARTSTLG